VFLHAESCLNVGQRLYVPDPLESLGLFGGLTLSLVVLPSGHGLLEVPVKISPLGMPTIPGCRVPTVPSCLALFSLCLAHPDSFFSLLGGACLLLRPDVSDLLFLQVCWNCELPAVVCQKCGLLRRGS
jgi:hypothetical protein